jgi:hypothetical protein
MFNRNMGNGLWTLVKSLWFYGTLPDRNTNKQKLQPTMQPMQNKMEELNPYHHTRPYSNYESNFQTSYQTINSGQTKPLSQTPAAARHIPPLSQQSKIQFLCAPTSTQPVPAVPQVSSCSNRSRKLKQIDLLERRVEALENKHDYQIRLESGEISKPKYPDFPRFSTAVNPIIPDTVPAAVPEFDDSLTPAEIKQLEIWFPNGVPREAFLVADNHLPIPENVTAAVPGEKALLRIWYPNRIAAPKEVLPMIETDPYYYSVIEPEYAVPNENFYQTTEMAEPKGLMTVLPDSPNQDKSPVPESNWINPLGQKVPLPSQIQYQKPKADNNDTWWNKLTKLKKFLPAKQMKLPDDLNPTIIWDKQNGVWIDTSRNLPPPPPDKSYNWKGSPLTMEFDEVTGNWVDRKKEMDGVNPGPPGHQHQSQKNIQKLLQDLAAKNISDLEANRLAGLLSPAKYNEKVVAVRAILSESAKFSSLEDPASTESTVHTSYGTITPLSQKDPALAVPPKIGSTPKPDDNRILVDSHLPITKADPVENKVIKLAPRTPVPKSRPPRTWESPAYFSARENPYRRVKLQQPQHGKMELLPASFYQEIHQQFPVPSTIDTTPKLANNWWKTISKWLPAKKMKLPDDTNPTIIWDEKNGVWVDTSTNCPPPLDKYWKKGAPLTMVFDHSTGNWVDRKKYLCGANLGPGHHHQSQRKIQQMMLELAAKNTAQIESDIF